MKNIIFTILILVIYDYFLNRKLERDMFNMWAEINTLKGMGDET